MKEPRVFLAENAGLFTLDGTRTFVVGEARIGIVDPGPDLSAHLERVAAAVVAASAGTILLTHGHPDHAEGAEALARLTGFPILGDLPAAASPIEDGTRVPVDGGWLEAVATPGHARRHMAYLHRAGPETRRVAGGPGNAFPGGDLFAGDLLMGRGATTWLGAYGGCIADYLRSLDRVDALAPRRIFPAHGPVLERPKEAVAAFRAHRLRRIAEVAREWKAVTGGAPAPEGPELDRSLELLVERVYGRDLPEKSREGATWSARAALDHLGMVPFPGGEAPTEAGGRLAGDP